MGRKSVLEVRVEFPSGTEKSLKESISEVLKDFELALKFSLAQKLVEEKGLDKKTGKRLSEEIKKGVANRLGF